MSTPTLFLNVKRTLPFSREKVFKAWTEPEELAKWWGPPDVTAENVTVELKVGGAWRIDMSTPDGGTIISGEYREIDPPKRLVYTWFVNDDPDTESVVTIDFREADDGTEVSIVHGSFGNEESKQMHTEGWIGCFEELARVLSDG